MKRRKTFLPRASDFFLLIFLIALSVGGYIFSNSNEREGRFYTIEMNGETLYRLSLASDTVLVIRGRTGDIEIRARNGKVCIEKSSCPLKICVKTGWINKPGETIICVPNKMVVHIEGTRKKSVDAVTE